MSHPFSKQTAFAYVGGVLVLLCAIILLPVSAQDVRVALQSEEAGESADDDPADTGEPVIAETADDEETPSVTPAERAESLDRRAGEQVGDDPHGRAVVLGMHIQEGDSGRARVIEVGAASPAFDAGIQEGDEIIAFDGFKGKSYRDWIDGIRRLVTDTPDGETMAVDVLRDGKRVSTKVRAPVAKADDPRVPDLLGQQLPEQNAQGGAFPVDPNQAIAGAGSDNDVFISNGPLFGNEFDDAFSGATDRAMAEIRRLNAPQQTAQPVGSVGPAAQAGRQAGATLPQQEQPQPVPPNTPDVAASAARIGLAGFRNDQNGMLVMLDVGGLAPGTYRVSIDDPSLVMGGAPRAAGAAGTPQTQIQQPSNQGTTGVVSPDGSSVGTTGTGTPPGVVRGGTTPSGSRIPPTGQVDPNAGAPPTGRVLPPAATATGLPNAEAAAPTQSGRPSGQAAGVVGGTTPTLSEVGLLTVDQSGTGRLQQVVEGVQVRDVVGSAIVIYPPATPPETTVPPNSNVSGVAGDRVLTPDANETFVNETGIDDASAAANPQNAASRQVPGAEPQSPATVAPIAGQSEMPIAGGIIRLMSDRRPQGAAPAAAADGAQPAAATKNQQLQQPATGAGRAASQLPPTGQQPTR